MDKILEKLAVAAFNWGLRRLLGRPDLPRYTPTGLTHRDVDRIQAQIDSATRHRVD
jgi:hypothetical protein